MVRAAFGGAGAITTQNLGIYMAMGNSLTNKVAANDVYGQLDASDLQLIETLLACHYCAAGPNEQQYSARTTVDASATFQGQTGMVLKSTLFGQNAMMLDTTNYLARHSKEVEEGYRQVASLISLASNCWETTQEESYQDTGPED
jgi:hypothetical protein